MAKRNLILLDLDNPNVVVKPIDDGEKVQCYHIQAWLNFDEFQDAEAVTAADLKEAFTKGYVPQLTQNAIAERMRVLANTGDYPELNWHELHKVAVEMLEFEATCKSMSTEELERLLDIQEVESDTREMIQEELVRRDPGSGFYLGDGSEILESDLTEKMKFLSGTGEYDGFTWKELRQIAVQLIQRGD